jgi:hypothetical protein
MRNRVRTFLSISSLFACTPEGQSIGASTSLESSESGEAGSTNDMPTTTTTSSGADPGSTGGSSSSTETGSTGSSTTDVVVPFCGDDEVDFGEECDEGLELNSPNAYCTDNCKFNVCGDGKWFVGWELCDLGESNSNNYGSYCNDSCEPSARCGDSLLDLEYGEQCDLGADNGSGQMTRGSLALQIAA